jgi:hypothetical protein
MSSRLTKVVVEGMRERLIGATITLPQSSTVTSAESAGTVTWGSWGC